MANLVLLGTLLLPVLVTGALDGAAGGKGKGEAHRLLQAAGDEEGSWGEGMEVVNQHAVAPSKMSGVSAAIPDLASLAKGGIIGGQCKTEDCNDFDLLIHDEDRDGRVTREEFAGPSPHAQAGATNEAFACLDTDMNGYVTREERDALKTRFFKSHLSKLNEEEVMEWLTYRKCMPTDLTKYVKSLRRAHLNGLALWEVGVKNPSLLKVEFGIVSPLQRRTIVQAICREIEGLGCLGEGKDPIPVEVIKGVVGPAVPSNPQDQFFMSKEQGGRDTNHDGQVSKAEFTKEQGPGSAEAFSCLDPDDDGQITREEMFDLKTRFFRSRLSHLTVEEVRAWLSSQKCVPIDMSEHVGSFRAKEINGLSLWKYGVKNPSLLKNVLGIQSEIKRATLTQAICREIEGSGCLAPSSASSRFLPGDSEEGSSAGNWIMNILIFGSLALSIVCPLFRAKKARDVMKDSQNREAEMKGKGLFHFQNLQSMGNGALGHLQRLGMGARDAAFGGKVKTKRGGTTPATAVARTASVSTGEKKGLKTSASEADLDSHHYRTERHKSLDHLQNSVSHRASNRVLTDGGNRLMERDEMRRSWHAEDFDDTESQDNLSDAVNLAFPNKSAYLGPSGQKMQQKTVKRVESIQSDASGGTFGSTGTHGSTAAGSTGDGRNNQPGDAHALLSTLTGPAGTNRSNAITVPQFPAVHRLDGAQWDTHSSGTSDRDVSLNRGDIDGGFATKVNKKECYYNKCKTPFSSNALLRRLQRHKCQTCCQYFCSAHKKKKNHGCPDHMQAQNQKLPPQLSDLSNGAVENGQYDDMWSGSEDGEFEFCDTAAAGSQHY